MSLCLLGIVSCGNNDVPPVLTQDEIAIKNPLNGKGSIGAMTAGEIHAYAVKEGATDCNIDSAELIDSGNIDEEGLFSLTLNIHSGVVLYIIRDASYQEEASREMVSLNQQQELKAVSYYDSARTDITITPWSHLQTGLFCRLLASGEKSVEEAEEESAEFVINMLGFDHRYQGIRLASAEMNNRLDIVFDDALSLGFMNAALSQLSLDISREIVEEEHFNVHSIYLAQLFYEDIWSDGILDGRRKEGPLSILGKSGFYQLSDETYRIDLPLRLLYFYDNNPYQELTGRGRGELYAMASRINSNEDPAVFSNPSPPLDDESPEITWLSAKVLSGAVNISLRIKDLTAVDVKGTRFIGPNSRSAITYKERNLYTAFINTSIDGNGLVYYRIEAHDSLGNNGTSIFPIDLINAPPRISFNSRQYTVDGKYTLSASYELVSRKQKVTNSSCALEGVAYPAEIDRTRKSISCSLPLVRLGNNILTLRACDDRQFCSHEEYVVMYDNAAPQVRPIDERSVYHDNLSLNFDIRDELSLLQEPVEWEMRGNGQVRYGNAKLTGENNYRIFSDLAPFGSGLINLVVRARDNLNNIKEHSYDYRVVNVPAQAELISSPWFKDDFHSLIFRVQENSFRNTTAYCWISNRTSPTSSTPLTDGMGRCDIFFPNVEDGVYEVNIRLCGDYSLCTTDTELITKDTTGPRIDLTGFPPAHTNNSIRIFIAAKDTHSSVERLSYQLDDLPEKFLEKLNKDWLLPLDLLKTGMHRLTVKAWDARGNLGQLEHNFITIADEPSFRLASAPATAEDIYTLQIRIDSGSYEGDYKSSCGYANTDVAGSIRNNMLSCILNLGSLAEGAHNVEAVLTPDYGRQYGRTFSLIKDTQAPYIDWNFLAREYTEGAVPLSISISDTHSAVNEVFYKLDDEEEKPLISQADGWGFILPVDQLTTGTHSLRLRANDAVGNEAAASRDFLVLRDEPRLMRTSSSSTAKEAYTFVAEMEPGTYRGAYEGTCQLNNVRTPASIEEHSLSCPFDLSQIDNGNYTIDIVLTPHDYEREYSFRFSLVKDTAPPSVLLELASVYFQGGSQILVGIDDALSPIERARYQIDEQPFQDLIKRQTDYVFTLPVPLATGRHSVRIEGADTLGNEIIIAKTFLLLKDSPLLTLTSPRATKDHIYTLTATVDPRSYEGSYSAVCRYGGRAVPAAVSNNDVSCSLAFGVEGRHEVTVFLHADYGRSYEFREEILKDITPPVFILDDIATEYPGDVVPVRIRIEDSYSKINNASATWAIDGIRNVRPLIRDAVDGWNFILPAHLLPTGRHTIMFSVSDVLGNEGRVRRSFLLLKDEPSITRISEEIINREAYTFIARIDAGSYEGSYEAICRLSGAVVSAYINNNVLSCPLDLSMLSDQPYDVIVDLVADYDRRYERTAKIIKDTTPPAINSLNAQPSYGREVFTMDFTLDEVGRLFYHYAEQARQTAVQIIQDSRIIHRITVDPMHLSEGAHEITLIASDTVNNQRQEMQNIFIVKEPPRLGFAHPRLTNHSPTSIYGNFSSVAAIGNIRCFARNFYGVNGHRAVINREDGRWQCDDIFLHNGHVNEAIVVEICDVYDNCRRENTFITYDDSLPIIVNSHNYLPPTVNYLSACAAIDYDNDTENEQCIIVSKEDPDNSARVTDWYNIRNVEERIGEESPRPIVILQQYTNIDYEDIGNLTFLASYDFVGVDLKDSSHSNHYSTTADRLNITYSYTQLNCFADNADCVEELHDNYFRDRTIPYTRLSPDGESVRLIIPFTNQFLNIDGKPLWYLAPTSTIHKISIKVCDEIKNCLELYTHFRAKIYAEEPVVRARIQDGFLSLLQESDDYARAMGSITREGREWEVINPSASDLWISATNIERISVEYYYHHYRKKNRYRKHRVREYEHSKFRSAACGHSGPFWSRKKRLRYRIHHQYLTDPWQDAYRDTPTPSGSTYGTHEHSFEVRHSCSSPGTEGITLESRRETDPSYPRIVMEGVSSTGMYNFTNLLDYYYIGENNERNRAHPQRGYYRIKSHGRLIVVSQELFQGAPFLPSSRSAVYDMTKKMDRFRDIAIPLNLFLSFAPSIYTDDGVLPDGTAIRTVNYRAFDMRFYRKDLGVHCSSPTGSLACRDILPSFTPQ